MQGQNKGYWVCRKKMQTSAEALCRQCHSAFKEFTDIVINLKFEEEPDYARYINMFEPLINVPDRPLQVDTALRVSLARHHSLQVQSLRKEIVLEISMVLYGMVPKQKGAVVVTC